MSGQLKSDWIKLQSDNVLEGVEYRRNLFAAIAKWFDEHQGFDRVASNYGVGGLGLGFSWEPNAKAGDGAFGVWRAVSSSKQTATTELPEAIPPYDIVFVLGTTNIAATSSWEPAGNIGVWYTLAYHSSSASWNGSANNNGQDNWTTTPWKSGSIVLCRSNGSGGVGSGSLNGLTLLDDAGGNDDKHAQLLITGDYDTTTIALRYETGITPWNKVFIFGGYQRATSSVDVPLVNLKWPPFTEDQNISSQGSLSFSSTDVGVATTSSIGVKKLAVDYPEGFINDNRPNAGLQYYAHHASSDTVHNYIIEWPMVLLALEWDGSSYYTNTHPNYFLVGGHLHNIRVAGTNGGMTRLYNQNRRIAVWFAGGNAIGLVFTLPWNSGSVLHRDY